MKVNLFTLMPILCLIFVYFLSESKSKQVFDKAMKAGIVCVNTTNVLLFGMAGTGKTSTKHLLLGLDPPSDQNRESTPCANKSERVYIRQIRRTQKLKMEAEEEDIATSWKPVSNDDLQESIVNAIKYSSDIFSFEENAISQELGIALKQLETIDPPSDSSFVTSKAYESNPSSNIPRQKGLGRKNKAFLETVSNFTRSIQHLTVRSDDVVSTRSFGSNWIYLIDSGGQPHFHNLLPLFIPRISVSLYVLRLSDGLYDHPLVKYYKAGEQTGEPFESHLSVLDNFKYLVQSIQSHNKDCKLICIGTHKDQEWKCVEKIADKNRILKKFAEKECIKTNTIFYHLNEMEIVFPLDCKTPNDFESNKIANYIRQYIGEIRNEIKVPLWWYVLEISIEKVLKDLNGRKVLRITECEDIAKALNNFHEDALFEALKYFHRHNIFHYYPEILSNIVFCDTQVLLDKVTEIVKYTNFVRESKAPVPGQGNWLEMIKKGIISIKILSDKKFGSHFVEGLFEPTHLVTIFKHLMIATPFRCLSDIPSQDEQLYMPSILSMLSAAELNKKRAALTSIPLVLWFKNSWQFCGVFCCLQVYLIKEREWEIDIEDADPPSRNFVQLTRCDGECSITLIDSLSFVEIYCEVNSIATCSEQEILFGVYKDILSGFECSYKALKYMYEKPEVSFLCPHSEVPRPSSILPDSEASSSQHVLHPAVVLSEKSCINKIIVQCTQKRKCLFELTKDYDNWFSACFLRTDYGAMSQPFSYLSNESEGVKGELVCL